MPRTPNHYLITGATGALGRELLPRRCGGPGDAGGTL